MQFLQVNSRLFVCATLVLICIAAFAASLGCYFLADDFYPITYLFQGFHGHPQLLAEKLFSPWQVSDIQLFYRPLSELSLICDYAIYGPCASGFHATNLLIHCAVCVMLFFVGEKLLANFGYERARAVAFMASALFAANPLNAESVIWIIGRVDLLCALFYLVSLLLFLNGRQSLSVAAFVACLCAKETGVTLPFLLIAYVLITADSKSQSTRYRLLQCVPFFVALAGFAVVRRLVIGEWIGGYRGSIADAYNLIPWHYPLTNGNLWKLFYPVNDDFIFGAHPLLIALHCQWIALGCIVLLCACLYRLGERRFGLSLGFTLAWLAVCVLPAWKLAIIQPTLAGGRFAYLPLMPASLALALLWAIPLSSFELRAIFNRRMLNGVLTLAGCALCAALVVIFVSSDQINNRAWLEASAQARALQAQVQSAVSNLPPEKKLIILNVPTHYHGAHLCYRDEMLRSMLSPPFMSCDLSGRVEDLQLHHDGGIMNVSLLKRETLGESNECSLWDCASRTLRPFPAASLLREANSTAEGLKIFPAGITAIGTNFKRDGYTVRRYVAKFDPPLNPASVKFIRIDAGWPALGDGVVLNALVQLRWKAGCDSGYKDANLRTTVIACDRTQHQCRISVGDCKPWLSSQSIDMVMVELPLLPMAGPKLAAIVAEDGATLVPRLECSPTIAAIDDGSVVINSSPRAFLFDATRVENAKKVLVEISRPRSAFEHFSGRLRDSALCNNAMRRFSIANLAGSFRLSAREFPEKAVYQVRLFAVDAGGRICGFASDPTQVQVL